MNLKKRLEKLEGKEPGASREVLRVIVGCVVGKSNLGTSTCSRTMNPSGVIMELVHLDGGLDGLSDEDLDRWVATFPIEPPVSR